MTQGFRDLIGGVAEFDFFEGPFEVNEDIIPPEPALIKRGFKTPFRAWFYPIPAEGKQVEDLIAEYLKSHNLPEDLEARAAIGFEESVDALANKIRKDGPFDGVMSFSQGCAVFRTLNFFVKNIKPEKYKDVQLPKFVISQAGSVFIEYLALLDGKLYGPTDYKVKGVDSLHIFGSADPLYEYCLREPGVYADSPDVMKQLIVHTEGHKVFHRFTKDQMTILQSFLERQLLRANGIDQTRES
jgi:hypothetical protein